MRQVEIPQLVFAAIEDLNRQLAPGDRLQPAMETRLMSPGGGLDSLGFVNLIVLIEQKLEEQAGKSISLIDERRIASADDPFADVQSLVKYVEQLVRDCHS